MDSLAELHALTHDLSILFVDDNDALREQSARLFSSLFDTVWLAAEGKEGLRLFKEKRPDIVITDITMPKMDGTVALRRILAEDPRAQVHTRAQVVGLDGEDALERGRIDLRCVSLEGARSIPF
jgi:CheY-like chemotaxis protein